MQIKQDEKTSFDCDLPTICILFRSLITFKFVRSLNLVWDASPAVYKISDLQRISGKLLIEWARKILEKKFGFSSPGLVAMFGCQLLKFVRLEPRQQRL